MTNLLQNRHLGIRNEAIRDKDLIFVDSKAGSAGSGKGPRALSVSFRPHLQSTPRSIPDICRELGSIPASTLYHYLHADGTLKEPGRRLLDA